MYDYIIVGAGLSGSVLAERLASQNKRILIVEKRNHIGGNVYDYYDEHGFFVHKYGPHIFHTNDSNVFNYLSEFTKWRQYEHHVKTYINGELLPFPINLNTIEQLKRMNYFWKGNPILTSNKKTIDYGITTSFEEYLIGIIGLELYDLFYKNYTIKQWGIKPSILDYSVAKRVLFRDNYDNRYFTDKFQGIPKDGYTKIITHLIDRKNIDLLLDTDYGTVKHKYDSKGVIFTGKLDSYFDYRFGKLEYRSVKFIFKYFVEEQIQEVGTINFPNDYDFTRITELKILTGQKHLGTTLMYEYPCNDEDEPFYPIPTFENLIKREEYLRLSEQIPNVFFLGRLGKYQYLNMDEVVRQALDLADQICS